MMNESSAPALDPRTARLLPWLIAMAFFMQMLDTTIVNTALPAIARALDENPLQMQSVIISYMLTLAMLTPISGWVADRCGIKKTFFAAIVVFSLGSLLCGISGSLEMLVVSRVIQGTGGAMLMPIGRLVVLKAYPRSSLVRVLSFIVIPGLIGPLVGPIVGGFIVQYATWHYIFLINLPLGVAGCVLTIKWMPELKAEKKIKFDWIGFLLFAAAIVCVTLALEALVQFQLPVSPYYLMAAGVVIMIIYWIYASKALAPLFQPSLFKIRSFSVGLIGNLFGRICSGSMPYLAPIFLQLGLGFSPFNAGLMMIPLALGAIVAKKIIPWLLKKVGYRMLLVLNSILIGVTAASFFFIGNDTSLVLIFVIFWIFATFNSFQFTAMSTMTIIDLPEDAASSGNSLFSVIMQVSMTMGVAIAAIILNSFFKLLPACAGEYSLPAFHYTFITMGAISILTSVIFAFTPAKVGESD